MSWYRFDGGCPSTETYAMRVAKAVSAPVSAR